MKYKIREDLSPQAMKQTPRAVEMPASGKVARNWSESRFKVDDVKKQTERYKQMLKGGKIR